MEKQGGISPRYSPSTDRDHAHPKTPFPTFQATPLHTLTIPEMQKAAVGGLIQEIIVHPTAALEIQCSFQTCFQTIALRGIEPRSDG